MSEKTYIYGLLCPITNRIRYVGKSNDPEQRYHVHANLTDLWSGIKRGICLSSPTTKQQWIMELHRNNLKPQLVILEEVDAVEELWRVAEHSWMERLQSAGHPLTNSWRADPRTIRKLAKALNVEPSTLVR